MKSVTDIITLLPELNLTDLKAVQAALDKEVLKHLSIDEDLYSLVFDITGEKRMSISKFFGTSLGIQWRKSQPIFDDLIVKISNGLSLRQVTLRALKRFILEMIVDHIRERSMPLSMRTICDQLGKVQEIFDRSFPGYLASSLGSIIIKKLESGNG
jgi:hypothetical protein